MASTLERPTEQRVVTEFVLKISVKNIPKRLDAYDKASLNVITEGRNQYS